MYSFKYAIRGLGTVFREELSFRVQAGAAVVVLGAIALFPLRRVEIILLLLLIFLVLVLEVLNSVIERIADIIKPRLHEGVEVIKDMMAGAVLLASVGALLIGLIIIVPYLAAGAFRW